MQLPPASCRSCSPNGHQMAQQWSLNARLKEIQDHRSHGLKKRQLFFRHRISRWDFKWRCVVCLFVSSCVSLFFHLFYFLSNSEPVIYMSPYTVFLHEMKSLNIICLFMSNICAINNGWLCFCLTSFKSMELEQKVIYKRNKYCAGRSHFDLISFTTILL